MRYLFIYLLGIMLCAGQASAKGHKRKHDDLPKTQQELMVKILECLQNKDSLSYSALFPTFDTLYKLTGHVDTTDAQTMLEMIQLRKHPQALMELDPYYNNDILPRFYYVAQKGEDSGIHWNSIVLQRFELEKESLHRDQVGLEKIATERYKGYIFVRDMLGRTTYCITVAEMMKIQGYWYGGIVLNIFEASTIDEYMAKQAEEGAYFTKMKELGVTPGFHSDTSHRRHVIQTDMDTSVTMGAKQVRDTARNLKIATTEDDDKQKNRLEVIDRKYYEGRFDNEIPVKLYVRYMRGECPPAQACYYDAIYKFGDMEKYVKLEVTKNAEGKWEMDDDPKIAIGSMELTLNDKIYTGSWTNNKSQTGYDVYMTQKDLPPTEIESLDNIIEKGLWAKPEDMNSGQKKTRRHADDGNLDEDGGDGDGG